MVSGLGWCKGINVIELMLLFIVKVEIYRLSHSLFILL